MKRQLVNSVTLMRGRPIHRLFTGHRGGGNRRALAIATDLGDRVGETSSLQGLAQTSMLRDRYDDAYRQAVAIATDLGDRLGEAYSLRGLGDVHRAQARPGEAADAYRRAEALFRQLGMTSDATSVAERLTTFEAEEAAPASP